VSEKSARTAPAARAERVVLAVSHAFLVAVYLGFIDHFCGETGSASYPGIQQIA
jgi:hypothetical protein